MEDKGTLHEKDFSLENYDNFYEHHYFKPLPDNLALNANRVLPRVDWAVDVAEVHQPSSVLDLGCLDGFSGLTVANHTPSVQRLVGVDLSKDGIDIAKTRKDLVKARTDFYQQSIESFLERTDEKFDMIILFEVIEHVKDPKELIKLIDRVKTKPGVVLVSTPDFEAPTYGKDDEQNKCHIRLFTTSLKDYEAVNKYGNTRKATSLPKLIHKKRIISIGVYSELINCIYN